MTSEESQLEQKIIKQLRALKYKHRVRIRDRATQEKDFHAFGLSYRLSMRTNDRVSA